MMGWGWGGLAQLKRTAESQTGGPVWLAVLLRDGPKKYLPGEGSHPKSSGLDTTQALVNGAGGREVHGADFVPTGAQGGDMMLCCSDNEICCWNGNSPPKMLGLRRTLAWSLVADLVL